MGARPLNFTVRQPVNKVLRTSVAVLLVLRCLPALADGPTADELYDRFKAARLAYSDTGPAGALDLFSRKWLTDGISNAFDAAARPRGEIDYVKDALWAHFSPIGDVDAVFSYRLVADSSGAPALEMRVATNRCRVPGGDRPRLDTYSFVHEDGGWRIASIHYSRVPKDLTWYRPDDAPKDRFPYIHFPDRTAVWNESLARLGSTDRVSDPCAETKSK